MGRIRLYVHPSEEGTWEDKTMYRITLAKRGMRNCITKLSAINKQEKETKQEITRLEKLLFSEVSNNE